MAPGFDISAHRHTKHDPIPFGLSYDFLVLDSANYVLSFYMHSNIYRWNICNIYIYVLNEFALNQTCILHHFLCNDNYIPTCNILDSI